MSGITMICASFDASSNEHSTFFCVNLRVRGQTIVCLPMKDSENRHYQSVDAERGIAHEVSEGAGEDSHLEFRAVQLFREAEGQVVALVREREEGLNVVREAAQKAGVSPEELHERMQRSGLGDTLQTIEHRGRNLRTRFLRRALLLLAACVIAPGSAAEAQMKERPAVAERDIRTAVRTNANEQGYISMDGKHFFHVTEGTQDSESLHLDELRQYIKDHVGDVRELQIIHTHPQAGYRLLGLDVDAIERGEVRRVPIPPSFIDIFPLISHKKLQELSAEYGIQKVARRVYEPTGMWLFTLRTDHPQIEKIARLERAVETLTAAYQEVYNKTVRSPGSPIADSELDAALEAQIQALDERDEALDALGAMGDRITEAQLEVANPLLNEEGLAQAIQKYIRLCGDIGIAMEYRPYEQ